MNASTLLEQSFRKHSMIQNPSLTEKRTLLLDSKSQNALLLKTQVSSSKLEETQVLKFSPTCCLTNLLL